MKSIYRFKVTLVLMAALAAFLFLRSGDVTITQQIIGGGLCIASVVAFVVELKKRR